MYSYLYLVICQYLRYPSGRNLSYFQNMHKNNIHPQKYYAKRFGNITNRISAITFNHFFDFRDYCLICYCPRSAKICCNFEGFCARQKFSFLPVNCLIRYLIIPICIDFPQFSKILQLYRMTGFCTNVYISYKFFNIFSMLPATFTTVVYDRLSLNDYKFSNWVQGLCWYCLNALNGANQEYHRPRNRVKRYCDLLQYKIHIEPPIYFCFSFASFFFI